MKRDVTVWVSLGMVAIPWLIGWAMGMPQQITADDPIVFHAFSWTMFLGVVRVIVFWFQTLIHGIQHAKEENRVAVVLGHIFLGPIMAYGYYISSRHDTGRAASDGL